MKKWVLHSTCCVLNALAATAFLVVMTYSLFSDIDEITTNDIPLFALVLFCFFIYILVDYWGIKLYKIYKNKDRLSFTNNRIISAILFFNCIVQIGCGYLVTILLPKYLFNFKETIETGEDGFWVLGLLVIIVFLLLSQFL